MPDDLLKMKAEAQQVVDELWGEKLIPFALNVGKITKAPDDYTIHFHDSRLRTARVPLAGGSSFRDMVRSSVLDRVDKMSGPLKKPPTMT
ncbi:MAG: hypothetical protein ABJC05_02090 [Pyrinomonadaceae bacterium]